MTRCVRVATAMIALLLARPARPQILVSDVIAGIPSYAENATGNVPPLAKLAVLHPEDLAVDPVHGEIFALNFVENFIKVFPLGAAGNTAPLRTIEGPSTLLEFPASIVLDLVHDELLISNYGGDAVLVFARGANGNIAPLRRIAGLKTTLFRPGGLALDVVGGNIFVGSNFRDVLVFGRTAQGNVAPKRTISGPKTKLVGIHALRFDALHNELLVADNQRVAVFPPGAQGNVSPTRSFTYAGWHESRDAALLGVSELIVADSGFTGGPSDPAITVFNRTAAGTPSPKRTIRGAATGMISVSGVEVARRALLLRNGRFAIEATWRTKAGGIGGAIPVALTSDTGYLWFFGQDNVEVVIKVLDGCALNQRFWVFAAGLTDTAVELTVTDLATGRVKSYENPQGQPFQPIQDTNAFATCGSSFAASTAPSVDEAEGDFEPQAVAAESTDIRSIPAPAFGCAGLCLNQERFEIQGTWTTSGAATGTAHGVGITADTGYQWFFNPQNVETVVKVIDACALNNRYWVFAGGLTNTGVELRVTDKKTGAVRTYFNPVNSPFQPVQDTAAFATCP